jgi:hypothetical protein
LWGVGGGGGGGGGGAGGGGPPPPPCPGTLLRNTFRQKPIHYII